MIQQTEPLYVVLTSLARLVPSQHMRGTSTLERTKLAEMQAAARELLASRSIRWGDFATCAGEDSRCGLTPS
jgi:hypothetical protein